MSRQSPLAAIHVDLDGAKHIFRTHAWSYRGDTDVLFETGLRNALHVFSETNVSATLFVIAEDLLDSRKCDLIRAAAAAGHDIASHSVTHRLLTRLRTADKRAEIDDSRRRLADVLGVNVQGFRAPAFNVDRECLELVDEAGYTYDSSVLPRSIAFRRSMVAQSDRPHHPLQGRPLIELPMPAAGRLSLPFHPSYSLVLGNRYFERRLESFRARNAPLVLLFHLTDFADPLPPSLVHGWRQQIFTLSHLTADDKRARCCRMLDFARRHFTMATTADLLASFASDARPAVAH